MTKEKSLSEIVDGVVPEYRGTFAVSNKGGVDVHQLVDAVYADKLKSALKVSVEALEYYANHSSVIAEAYHSNDKGQVTCVHTFINHKATEAQTKIISILKGGV